MSEVTMEFPDGYKLKQDTVAPENKGAGYKDTYRLVTPEGQEVAFVLIDENKKIMVAAHTPDKRRIAPAHAAYIIAFLKDRQYAVSSWVCDASIIQQDQEYYFEDQLPEGFYFRDALNLKNCFDIRHLPRGLTIDGTLFLEECEIEELPDDLTVHGRVAMANCFTIRHIGKNCKVGGHFILYDLPLEFIGDGLEVAGNLSITAKPFPLPNHIKIGGDFYLVGDFTTLPAGLRVGGDLNIEFTKITEIPKDAMIGGKIISRVPIKR